MIKKKKEKTVKDILNIFLPKIWIMLIVGAILAGCIGVWSVFLKKDTYTTTTEVIVSADTSTGNLNNTQTNQFAQQVVKSYEKVIFGGVFLEDICAILANDTELGKYFISESDSLYQNLSEGERKITLTKEKVGSKIEKLYGDNGITVSALKKMISVKADTKTPTFVLKVTTGDRMIACAISQVLVSRIEEGALDKVVQSNLKSTINTHPENNYTKVPANSKNTVRNAGIAFVIGFILAAVAVWLFSTFDVVIRDVSKIEENLDVPILGVIPRHEINSEEGKKK